MFLLEGDGTETLVATVLGGVTAGYRLAARAARGGARARRGRGARAARTGAVPGGPRTRANVVLDPLPGGAGDPDLVPADRLFGPAERIVNAPFSPRTRAARSSRPPSTCSSCAASR